MITDIFDQGGCCRLFLNSAFFDVLCALCGVVQGCTNVGRSRHPVSRDIGTSLCGTGAWVSRGSREHNKEALLCSAAFVLRLRIMYSRRANGRNEFCCTPGGKPKRPLLR